MSCLRREKSVSGENDLATVFPQLAAQWDAEKNGSLTPETVSPNLQPARLVEVRKGTRLLRCDSVPGAEQQWLPLLHEPQGAGRVQ